MAAIALRKSAANFVSKAAAAVKSPPILCSAGHSSSTFLGSTRSIWHPFTSPQNGFNPLSRKSVLRLSNFTNSSAHTGDVAGVRHYSSRPPKGDGSNMSEKRNIWDHKRRLLAAKYELRRKLHKALCMDPDLPSDLREKHRIKLSKLPRNSSFTRVRNRCIFSGRARAVYKKFRMSRLVFRELASNGSLMGVKKASW